MIDNGEKDDKIIAIATNDPAVNHVKEMSDLSPHFLEVVKNFFEQYKVLEKKLVEIDEFQDRETAYKIINDSVVRYKEKYPQHAAKK
jgi:inorganic pyrophosphatase